MKMTAREKANGMKAQNFGIEIEMYDISRENAAKVAAEFFGGRYENTAHVHGYRTWSCYAPDGREWKFSRDSSIDAACDAERCEMVTPILQYEDLDTLMELVRVLRKNGAKSNPEHGCGVHIHVDGAGHTAQTIKNLINLVYSHEDQIFDGINVDEAREECYCKKVDIDFLEKVNAMRRPTMKDIEDAWYGAQADWERREHYNYTRYHMLNLHSFFNGHGTVEFRCFQFQNPEGGKKNGLHAGQLKAMVQMALALNYQAKVSTRCLKKKSQKANTTASFKSWLYRLGFVGEEFRTARQYWTRETARTAVSVEHGWLSAA